MATLAYIKGKVGDAITSSVSENGKSQSERITEKACTILEEKIPVITTNITNEIISKLNAKIDSESFSTDFVNILQQKLLEENKTSEPFLSKFSTLFDKIIKKAEENYENEKQQDDNTSNNASTIVETPPVDEASPVVETPTMEEASSVVETLTMEEAVTDTDKDITEENNNVNSEQFGGKRNRKTRRGKRKVKMQTRKRKRRTNKRHNKK